MSLQGFLVAFGTVLLAELPDKTMVASLVLTTKFRRPFAVWVGVSSSFVLHVLLAVTIGSVLRTLPEAPVRLGVALLFTVGGVLLLRADDDGDDDVVIDDTAARGFMRIALASGSVVGLAEFGDLTQLATASIATQYSAPVSVGLGAWCALATVAALAVTVGSWIVAHVPLRIVQRVAGVVFLGLAALAVGSVVVSAFT